MPPPPPTEQMPIWALGHHSCLWILLCPPTPSSRFSFRINLSHLWWEQCLEPRAGLLLGKSFLSLSAKISHSVLYGADTIILPCFHIYFVLIWIRVTDTAVCPTLLGSARGQRESDYLPRCPSLSSNGDLCKTDVGWNTSLTTFPVISIFSCSSHVVPDWLEFGTFQPILHEHFFLMWTAPFPIFSSSKL